MSLENKLGCSLYVRAGSKTGGKGRQNRKSKKTGTLAAGKLQLAFHSVPSEGIFRAGCRLLPSLRRAGYEQAKLPNKLERTYEPR